MNIDDVVIALDDLSQQMAHLQESVKPWYPVTQKPPEHLEVLACCREHGEDIFRVVYYDAELDTFLQDMENHAMAVRSVTYWMNIPHTPPGSD